MAKGYFPWNGLVKKPSKPERKTMAQEIYSNLKSGFLRIFICTSLS